MADTALNLITDALKDIRVIAQNEVPAGADAADALRVLNQLIDRWNGMQLTAFCDQTQKLAYPVRTPAIGDPYTLTVGPGGDIDCTRPTQIDEVWVLDNTSGQKYPQWLYTKAEFDRIMLLNTSSNYPNIAWYNPTNPLGVLSIWPIPTGGASYSQVIRFKEFLSSFASLSSAVQLPPGYYSALRYNLSPLLAPLFSKSAVAAVGELLDAETGEPLARTTLRDLKTLNQGRFDEPLTNDVPDGGTGKRMSVLTGMPIP